MRRATEILSRITNALGCHGCVVCSRAPGDLLHGRLEGIRGTSSLTAAHSARLQTTQPWHPSNHSRAAHWLRLAIILTGLFTLGCAQPAAPPPASAPALDGCAERLHDLCEPLLLFQMAHHRLPESLEEFTTANGHLGPVTCPTSGLPYVWLPDGPTPPGHRYEVLLADAKPVHGGRRWAIVAAQQDDGRAPTLRVSLLPPATPAGMPPARQAR